MTLLLIHTGGTIGMSQTAQGFAPKLGVVEDALNRIQNSGTFEPTVDLHILEPLIDSANAGPVDWSRISSVIAASHDAYDGFVVTHGTDTLAYTAAALCFALEGLAKPVIVTGSMLPLTIPGNDGERNLIDALRASTNAPTGVWVQFSGQRLHGARTRKSHSTDFDAFRSEPSQTPPVQSSQAFVNHVFKPAKVAILAMAPGLPTDMFQYAAEQCDGLVLRCYGSGTAPESAGLEKALKTAAARGIPVLAVSQCPEGGIAFGTYAAGSILRDNGVIDGRDMTVEAAYTKMLHALSVEGETCERLSRSLCGEFTAT